MMRVNMDVVVTNRLTQTFTSAYANLFSRDVANLSNCLS